MGKVVVNGVEYLNFEGNYSENLINAVSKIYYNFYEVNLKDDSFIKYHASKATSEFTDRFTSAYECLSGIADNMFVPEHKKMVRDFYDSKKWPEYLKEKDTVYLDAIGIQTGWVRTNLIVAERDENGVPAKVLVALQGINDIKLEEIAQTKQLEETKARIEELLIKQKIQLETDELTQLFNRRAYEKEMNSIDVSKRDFIYVAFDVNGLKYVNDHMGHAAGDEIIIGAAECMQKSFGKYGKVFRTGGDEFVAIIYVGLDEFEKIVNEFESLVSNWSGELVSKLYVAMGYSAASQDLECSDMHEISILADKRMYENKAEYYEKSGIDSRNVFVK